MAVLRGKRKRDSDSDESASERGDEGDVRALFQRAFEAKFKPLQRKAPTVETTNNLSEDTEDDDDWSGISDDDDVDMDRSEGTVEVYQHNASQLADRDSAHSERRAFMSSRPPSSASASQLKSGKASKAKLQDDDEEEASNVKNDLALQRLLKEAHLVQPSAFSGQDAVLDGKGRISAMDLRLKDLGAKASSTEQKRMPLSHRKGITAKANDRESRRRKDALENGIVLEKAKHATKQQTRRVRSIGGPAIGKFKGGTLKIGARDLRSIQGPGTDRKKRR